MSGHLTIQLAARPDPSYTATSHRGSIRIKPREVSVSSPVRAVETFAVFTADHNLNPVNVLRAGIVRRDGVPL